MMYSAGFDVSKLALGTITLSTSGKPDVVVNLSALTGITTNFENATLFFHMTNNGYMVAKNQRDPFATVNILEDFSVTTFASALQAALRAEAATQGWSSPTSISVLFDYANSSGSVPQLAGYVILYFTATFSIAWSTAAGRRFMGFSADVSGTTGYASNQVPWYCIVPTQPRASWPGADREPYGIASHAFPDDATGRGYGMRRETAPIWRDFIQEFEYTAKVEREAAAPAHPYTFRQMFMDCACEFPILAYDLFPTWIWDNGGSPTTIVSDILLLRPESAQWEPRRTAPGFTLQQHIDFQVYVLGGAP